MTVGSAKIGSGAAAAYGDYLRGEEAAEDYAAYIAVPDKRCTGGFRFERDFGHVMFSAEQLGGRGVAALGPAFAQAVQTEGGLVWGRFERLFNGQDPISGEQLAKFGHRTVLDDKGNEVSEKTRTGAIDLHFAAPKEVTLAHAIAALEAPDLAAAMLTAHQRAVARTMIKIEQTATLGRRTVATPTEAKVMAGGERLVTKPGHEREGQVSKQQGSRSERVVVDLIHVTATQHSAREVIDGRLPAPHMHSHVGAFAMAHDPGTGKLVQIDDYGLKSQAKTFDAWYMDELATGFQELGFELEFGDFDSDRNGRAPWRVKGITPEAVDFFSPGRQRKWDLQRELEDAADGKAVPGKVIQNRMRQSRRTKGAHKGLDTNPDFRLWADEAAAHGVTIADDEFLERLRAERAPVQLAPIEDRTAEFHRRLNGPNGFAKDDATFDAKAATEAIARCAEGLSFTDDEKASLELDAREALVVTRPARNPAAVLYTTRTMLAAERNVAAILAAKAAESHPRPTRAIVERAITDLGIEIDDEQRAAVDAVTSGQGVSIIEGWAGSGKTTCMRAAVAAGRVRSISHGGKPAWDQVVVVSTAGLTAQNTGRKLGADQSLSLEAFVRRVDRGRLVVTDRTLVLCDEAAMNSTWVAERFLTAAGPAQLVLVGDSMQAQAIGPGGTFEAAKKAHGAVELTNVHRQNDPADVEALAALRQGASRTAVESLARRGRVHVSDTAAERVDQVMHDYRMHREQGRSADDVRVIVDSSNVIVDELNRHIQRDCRDRGEIGTDAIEVRFGDGDQRRWMLHDGDHILFLGPERTETGEAIKNGTTGRIVALLPETEQATIRLDDGRVVTVEAGEKVGLAYASHHVKFQGGERPIIQYVPGSAATTNRNSAYSTGSRAVDELHVYLDHETHGDEPVEQVVNAWSKSPNKSTATAQLEAVEGREAQRTAASLSGAQRLAARRSLEMSGARERQLTAIAGPEVAAAIRTAPAYATLSSTLDNLRRSGANDTEMLRTALRQREVATASDPAAVLVYRLSNMERVPAYEQSSGIATPIDTRHDANLALRQEAHLELQRRRRRDEPADRGVADVEPAPRDLEATRSSATRSTDFLTEIRRGAAARERAVELERETPSRSAGFDIGMG